MRTITPTPEEMSRRIVRLHSIAPQKANLETMAGIPARAIEAISAKTIYLYMAPEGLGGANQNPGISGVAGLHVSVCRCPPGDGPALHSHERTVETFMTLKGEFEFSWGDAGEHATRLAEFDMISMPPRVMRKFRNLGTEDALLLVLVQGDNKDVTSDIQLTPETGQKLADEFGEDVRARIEQMGLHFNAELGSREQPARNS